VIIHLRRLRPCSVLVQCFAHRWTVEALVHDARPDSQHV